MWGRVSTVGDFGAGTDDDGVRGGRADELALSDFVCTEYLGTLLHDYDPACDFLDDLRPYEWIAEGHWTMHVIRATLPPGLLAVVDAVYTVPSTPELEDRKRQACEDVTDKALRANTYGNPPRDYVRAVVYDWIGAQTLDPGAWAKALQRDVKTLRRWRIGRHRVGLDFFLDTWLEDAASRLRWAMLARGVIAR